VLQSLVRKGCDMTDFLWFSDAQRGRIEPLLPTGVRGLKRTDDRHVLSGIVQASKCDGRWADCAHVYGPTKTLDNRLIHLAERGIWENIFSKLSGTEDAPDRLFIDSSPHAIRGERDRPLRPSPKRQQCLRLPGRPDPYRGDAAIGPPGRR
jgi:transposase